ncbi:MAG: hypothetical protein FJ271_07720 [Planctomycetes bacterium]|nr:hypothetical protein [Planctomycetota bacterium]
MLRHCLIYLSAALLTHGWLSSESPALVDPPSIPAREARLRRPIRLSLTDDGDTLLAANRDGGSISIIDTHKLALIGELRVGGKISDMVASGDLVLATTPGQLVVSKYQRHSLRELRRVKIGLYPMSVQVSPDGGVATVADLWSRRLAIIDLARGAGTTVDLPFAPRGQLFIPAAGKVIVADAFSGKLAVVNVAARKLESVRDLGGHNIRGLARDRSGKSLWLSHQRLNRFGHTVAGEIQNSNVLINHVRKLPLASLLDPLADATRDDQFYMVGDIERGAGDPADVAEIHDDQLLVALAGTNEVMIGRPEKVIWARLPVGQRPVALAVDRKRQRAYVANTFADSVSVLDLKRSRVLGEIALGTMPAHLTPAERGEALFHDARLSHLAWFSCQSCHPDGHSNGRLNDNFSDGSFGTPKRVLSLLGVKDTGPWAWNGGMPDLETQVRSSLTTTMRGPKPSAEAVRDLTAFLQTLPPPPSLAKARGTIDAEALKRGRKVFAREKCATCHTPATYTSAKSFDVGLKDENGQSHFNPPSLRGISQAGPYFHDGRARDLEEVFTRFRHQLRGALAGEELADLLHFLNSL